MPRRSSHRKVPGKSFLGHSRVVLLLPFFGATGQSVTDGIGDDFARAWAIRTRERDDQLVVEQGALGDAKSQGEPTTCDGSAGENEPGHRSDKRWTLV